MGSQAETPVPPGHNAGFNEPAAASRNTARSRPVAGRGPTDVVLRVLGAVQFFSELQAQIKSLNRHGNTLGI